MGHWRHWWAWEGRAKTHIPLATLPLHGIGRSATPRASGQSADHFKVMYSTGDPQSNFMDNPHLSLLCSKSVPGCVSVSTEMASLNTLKRRTVQRHQGLLALDCEDIDPGVCVCVCVCFHSCTSCRKTTIHVSR